jgi:hypothetical protein
MKRLILSAACALSLVSCGGPPARPNQNVGQPVPKSETKLTAPTIKVFVENSGSMDGYVKGKTDFETAVYSYLNAIQYADLGEQADTTVLKNKLELYYINSDVHSFAPDVKEFIDALEPLKFQKRGGNRNTSDMSDILATILSQTSESDISIFVSDCIFSPGKKYKRNDNADDYLDAQQIAINGHFVEKLKENPRFAVAVLRLNSQFNGLFYNKFDDSTYINDNRPFYIWLMGNCDQLQRLLKKVEIDKIKGQGVENVFMISNSNNVNIAPSFILNKRIGEFYIDKTDPLKITKAKAKNIAGNKQFQFAVRVNFCDLLVTSEYLLNPENYFVSNSMYDLNVQYVENDTYDLVFKLNQPIISKGTVKVSLLNKMPEWVKIYTDEDGLDINDSNAMEKTYGLKYLIEGVYEAFCTKQEYVTFTFKIE